jgi:hypothetical protein
VGSRGARGGGAYKEAAGEEEERMRARVGPCAFSAIATASGTVEAGTCGAGNAAAGSLASRRESSARRHAALIRSRVGWGLVEVHDRCAAQVELGGLVRRGT